MHVNHAMKTKRIIPKVNAVDVVTVERQIISRNVLSLVFNDLEQFRGVTKMVNNDLVK